MVKMTEIEILNRAGMYRDYLIDNRNEFISGKGRTAGMPIPMKQLESMVDGFIDGMKTMSAICITQNAKEQTKSKME
jgi:hypothetical protein